MTKPMDPHGRPDGTFLPVPVDPYPMAPYGTPAHPLPPPAAAPATSPATLSPTSPGATTVGRTTVGPTTRPTALEPMAPHHLAPHQMAPHPMGQDPAFGYAYDPATGLPLSDKSRVAAGVLSIVLGPFGAGRFYTGHVGIAIAQIVVTWATCGIGHLWPMIDGIIVLAQGGTDAKGRVLRS